MLTRLALLITLLLAACGGSGTGDPTPDRTTEPVHCVPEVPSCQ